MNPFELTTSALREPWRLWTGHLAHWSLGHAAVNLGACLLPLAFLPSAIRRQLLRTLPWMLPLGSLLLLPFLAGRPYRGASGLACLLWVAAAFPLARAGRWPEALVFGLGALLKSMLEVAGGIHPLSPDAAWEGLPMAHVTGAALGLGWGLSRASDPGVAPPESAA
ncbi:MAG: hypothetical protein HYZ13_11625 [Acidobacteria bacterium]|nr:hypothetical protein [Acidobacteriota bacterium]